MNMKKPTFNEFCIEFCDNLYTPGLSDELQCTGYIQLKKMIIENITPASLEEINRWETQPTQEELFSTPHIKYLRFIHPLLRNFIIEHWSFIKTLTL